MNATLINILQTSPSFALQQSIQLVGDDSIRHLVITFQLILLATLNHAKLKQITLFSFMIQAFESLANLTVSNDFDYYSMKYQTHLKLNNTQQFVSFTSVDIDKYSYSETNAQTLSLRYSFNSEKLFAQNKNSKIKFLFGNKPNPNNNKNTFQAPFSITNFKWYFKNNKNLRNQQKSLTQLPSSMNPLISNYDLEQGSFPIVYQTEKKNLNLIGLQNLQQLIRNLESYIATNTTGKKSHLFICHDMKGGYAQDTVFTNPRQNKRTNSYRWNYFSQTSIFNYFSHKTISIPPKHWRILCKKYKVKCLGTFIVEPGHIDQNFYLQKQFALKLVYVAKKYKFDGYLLNIEDAVKNIKNLEQWLKTLTQRIHEQISGSIVAWYDSVTTKGSVQYQNEVNLNNKIFYDLTDHFFTNYWWTDNSLKDDIAQLQPNKTIYIGNDVWGRGTFGGGQFNIYKAIDQIQKKNNPGFGAALFGPAYTYQKGGQNNNPYFKANQDKLYRGVQFDQTNVTQWASIDVNDFLRMVFEMKNKQMSNFDQMSDSKIKYQEVRMNSVNLWPYKNKQNIKLTFTFKIDQKLAQPNIFLNYKIVLKIRNSLTDEITVFQEIQRFQVPLLEKSVKSLSIYLQTKNIDSKTDLVIYLASSIKKSLIQQQLIISYYQSQKDWIQQVPASNIDFKSSFNTFFNLGHGDYFFFKGKAIFSQYDFMADFDIPQIFSLNHPFATDFEYHDAYIGGSSIWIIHKNVKLIALNLPNYDYSYPKEYLVKVVTKKAQFQSLNLIQSNGFSISMNISSKKVLQNGWTETIYYLTKQKFKKMTKMFFKQFDTWLQAVVSAPSLLGQLQIKPILQQTLEYSKPKIQLVISEAFKSKNQNQIFINIDLNEETDSIFGASLLPQRYMLLIQNDFACFLYIHRQKTFGKGTLQQINLNLSKKNTNIQLINLDNQFKLNQILLEKQINLTQLKLKSLGHHVLLRNY